MALGRVGQASAELGSLGTLGAAHKKLTSVSDLDGSTLFHASFSMAEMDHELHGRCDARLLVHI